MEEKTHSHYDLQEGPKDTPFTKTISDKIFMTFHYIFENFNGSSSL